MPQRSSPTVDDLRRPVARPLAGSIGRRSLLGALLVGATAWTTRSVLDGGAPASAATQPAVVFSIVRGTTSLDVHQADMTMFPGRSLRVAGHVWHGVALSDLLDAVGSTKRDAVTVVTTTTTGLVRRSAAMPVATALQSQGIIASTRDGRVLGGNTGPVVLVTSRGMVTTTGRTTRIEVTA